MVITRSESRIIKNQRKYKYRFGFSYDKKGDIFYGDENKDLLKRIILPKCKKRYKNQLEYKSLMPVGMYYLFDKYKTNSTLVKYHNKTKKLMLDRNFWKVYSSNYVIYAILVINYSSSYHACVLVINKLDKTIHLFEPSFGKIGLKLDILEKITEYFPETLFKTTFSDSFILQRRDTQVRYPNELGYCFSWCVWFIETCILNENENAYKINRKLSDLFVNINTLHYIRGYSEYYSRTIKNLGLSSVKLKMSKCNKYISGFEKIIEKIKKMKNKQLNIVI